VKHSTDLTVEELQADLDLSDAMAREAEHRWGQGTVALWVGGGFWGLAFVLGVILGHKFDALTVFAGAVVFSCLGFGIWDWSNRIMRDACLVITYED
jgi:hypothetical protein